nr:hypothetical protein L203_02373 [Cryptococcus depauperatus CBS 7841]
MEQKKLEEKQGMAREDYQDHCQLVRQVQEELREEVEILRMDEEWDEQMWKGAIEWVDDYSSIWRALRKNRFDPVKTRPLLLSCLASRLSVGLHRPIPSFPPYTDNGIFHILPLPKHTTLNNRPIAVLTPREVKRDEEGKLTDLKEYIWWGLEMCRRVARDWWCKGVWDGDKVPHDYQKQAKGEGGEGLVLLVDASGAGYRNLASVDLLPTLVSVGNSHFPSLIEAVYIINVGWAHTGMWNIVKYLLPRSALEKVVFLDSKNALNKVFNPNKLPRSYGGESPYVFENGSDPLYNYYSHHPSYLTENPCEAFSVVDDIPRHISFTNIADIYYSARNTPSSSKRTSKYGSPLISRRASGADRPTTGGWHVRGRDEALRMTKSTTQRPESAPPKMGEPDIKGIASPPPISTSAIYGDKEVDPRDNSFLLKQTSRHSALPSVFTSSTTQSTSIRGDIHTQKQSAFQRIKSLSDFHLYLSPSRLANIDLLSDSSDDEPLQSTQPITQRRHRVLRPALLEKGFTDIPLAPLSTMTPEQETNPMEHYKVRLRSHHAQWLETWKGIPEGLDMEPGPRKTSYRQQMQTRLSRDEELEGDEEPIPQVITVAVPNVRPKSPSMVFEPSPSPSPHSLQQRDILPYSKANPFFGYPALQTTRGIQPRYPRRRKRDLVKTLLFLFLLKIQSWRDSAERIINTNLHLPLNKSVTLAPARNPTEGLLRSAHRQGEKKAAALERIWDKEWWWMLIGVLLMRGSWGRVVLGPLEMIGLIPASGA